MGWFTRPLPQPSTAGEYGRPAEGFDFPSQVDLDSTAYPEYTGPDGGPEAHRGVTGALFQSDPSMPADLGLYQLDYLEVSGAAPAQQFLAPAPGSVDLVMARESGGVAGTNRIIHSVGPVDGAMGDGWTGTRTDLHRLIPQSDGPVTGGPDYGHTAMAAYYSVAQAAFSQAAAEAGMVAAL